MPSASAFLRAVSGAAVLRPDAALDALSEAACDDARALLEEATGASLPFARGPADGPPPLRVHFTRSLRDARARWLAAWKTLGSSLWAHDSGFFSKETAPAGPLFTAAWETFFRAHALPADERAGLDRELRAACAAVRATAGVPPSAGLGFEELLGLELAWQATSASRDEASPWAPLWALWQRGAWPAWLGGASWVVYVPLRDAAGRVEEPEELDGALAHATEQSVRVHAASALMELGLAPAGRERSVQRGYFVEHRAGSVVPLGVVCGLGRVRDPSVHIAIPSGNVSKRQCTVLWGDEPRRHVLSDARSTGGTWLNEARVGAPTALAQGDRVSFGDHAFSSWFAPALGDEERARGLSSPGALSLVPHEGTPARRLLRGAPRGGPAVDAAPAGDPGPVRSFIARVLDQSRGRSGVHRLGLLAERLLDEPWGGGGPRPDGAEAEALAALSEGLAAWPSALRDEWPVPPVWDRGARPAPALPVERAPSLRAFFERFHAAWDAAARRPFDPACAWPLFAMQRVNRPTGYSAWGEREARFLAGVDGASSVWSGPARARLRALGSRYARDPSPGAEFALRLVRKCSSGVTLAPWQPLLDAWLAGLWPALVPGPAVLVYPFASARNEPPGPGPLPAPARAGGGAVFFDYRALAPSPLLLDDPRPAPAPPTLAPLVLAAPPRAPQLSAVQIRSAGGAQTSPLAPSFTLGPCTRIEDPATAPRFRPRAPEHYPSSDPDALWVLRTDEAWWLDGPALVRVPVFVDGRRATSRTPLFPYDQLAIGETSFELYPAGA